MFISSTLTCAWQCVLYAPLHFVMCLFEGEHNVDPVGRLQEAFAVGAGLCQQNLDSDPRQWKEEQRPAATLTLDWRIWAVGMVRVTNSLVSCTVKRSVWLTDTLLTVSASGSGLPRLVRPMCLLRMCSTVSSFTEEVTVV